MNIKGRLTELIGYLWGVIVQSNNNVIMRFGILGFVSVLLVLEAVHCMTNYELYIRLKPFIEGGLIFHFYCR